MSQMEYYDEGFDELSDLLSGYLEKIENTTEILEIGAKELVSDVRKLPSPRSRMNGSGYTHLLDTVAWKRAVNEIEVGWGKYYGPMVEKGTRRMRAHPHMRTVVERNKERYYKKMIDYIGG